MRYGMVINLQRCIGCDACTIACKQANGTPPEVFWGRVVHKEVGEYPIAKVEYTPLLCMHCANAPCVANCPTGASVKDVNGIVYVIADKCIGCKQCIVVCPYEARWFMPKKTKGYFPALGFTEKEKVDYSKFGLGKVTKCDFCMDKVNAGEKPLCVRTCPVTARIFGDVDDPNSEVAKLLSQRNAKQLAPEVGTDPSVYYIG
jgi:molybdopterin-containing oxidoreductase family iron-sulfur binding subunit